MGAQVKKTVRRRKDFLPHASDSAPISGAHRKDRMPCSGRVVREEGGGQRKEREERERREVPVQFSTTASASFSHINVLLLKFEGNYHCV